MRKCKHCGAALPQITGRGRPRSFCSEACRKSNTGARETPQPGAFCPRCKKVKDRAGRYCSVCLQRAEPTTDQARAAGFGSNATALSTTIAALARLRDEHSALVEPARTLAELVDRAPGEARLHREYRASVEVLLDAGRGSEADEFDRLITMLNE
jgi:hypothetical protein